MVIPELYINMFDALEHQRYVSKGGRPLEHIGTDLPNRTMAQFNSRATLSVCPVAPMPVCHTRPHPLRPETLLIDIADVPMNDYWKKEVTRLHVEYQKTLVVQRLVNILVDKAIKLHRMLSITPSARLLLQNDECTSLGCL